MNLHVLTLPSWYPTSEDPLMGFFFKEQARWIMREGCQVGVIYPEIRSLRQLSWKLALKNRFQITSLDEQGLWTVRSHGWNCFPKLEQAQMREWIRRAEYLYLQYIRERGVPDVIHAQSCLWGGVAASELSRKYTVPYVITEHHSSLLLNQTLGRPIKECWSTPYIQKAIKNSSQFIAVSSALKDAIQNYCPKDAHIVPLPTDTDYFIPPKKQSLKPPYRLFCLAKLVPGKNVELLLHAMAELKGEPFYLEIGGFGTEELKLKALARELGLEQSVVFLGRLSREQVREAFWRAHCFVLPSDFETQGCVYVEAMSCGIPAIATRCGGPEDTITPETGMYSYDC
jgi:glycosyltransferase involved in cell wall biosynthesis